MKRMINKILKFKLLKLAVFLLLLLGFAFGQNAQAANPPPVQTFYVPIPEDQMWTTLQTIYGGTQSDNVRSVVSIAVVASGTWIYYDQWEDGVYEIDISNPANIYSSTNLTGTQIWGDGNTANGAPPGFPADILQAGNVIVLPETIDRNNPGAVLPPSTEIPYNHVPFNGGDKFASSNTVATSRSGWPVNPGSVLADAVELYDTNLWSMSFEAPIGQTVAGANNMFNYSNFVIQAAENNTAVTIDADANGSIDFNVTLNQGQSYLLNGGVLAGATVTADKPIQVHMMTGKRYASYESRWFTLLGTDQWKTAYYCPVGTRSTDPTAVFLYNPNTTIISITPSTSSGTGTSISVPPGGVARYQVPSTSPSTGAGFTSSNTFYAVAAIDADASSSTYDWGFALVPVDALTEEVLIGWGPGRDPFVASTQNSGPVWVMPEGANNVQICVDYNGDNAGAGTDSFGNKYDIKYTLNQYQNRIVYDPDGDQTGMILYVCDGSVGSGAKLVAAWGQDPSTATQGSPALDAGTGIPPQPSFSVGKAVEVFEDADDNGLPSPGDTLLYTIVIRNDGRVPVPDVIIEDSVPDNTTYVNNSTEINDLAINDDVSGTLFPLDEGGYDLGPLQVNTPANPEQGVFTITFQVIINIDTDATSIVNTAIATAGSTEIPATVKTPLAAISLEKTVYSGHNSGASCPGGEIVQGSSGDAVTYCFEVTNTGNTYLNGISITDEALGIPPAVVTLLSGNTLLAPGESVLYYFEATVSGDLINIARVNANPANSDGTEIPGAEDVTDTDTASIGQVSFGTVSGHLYIDTNGNGAQDAGEPNLANVNVIVTDSAGNEQTVATDNNGDWTATVPPGSTTVKVDEEDPQYPTGYTQTEGDDPTNVTAVAGVDTDAGNDGYYLPGTVSGHVYEDTNGNGMQDEGEPDLAGVDVEITDSNGNKQTVTTDADGNYSASVPPGETIIDIIESTLPENVDVQTEGTDTTTVTVTAGGSASDIDGFQLRNPLLSIDKELTSNTDEDESGDVSLNDTLNYTITATNDGNVPLTNVQVSDNLTGDTKTCDSVAPGNTCVLSVTYKVTQADVDSGKIENTGTADSDETEPVQDVNTVPVPQTPSVTLEKLTNGMDGGEFLVGSPIEWTFKFTNNGNVTLSNITVSDSKLGSICSIDALSPGEFATCTATGLATTGSYSNTGTVTGSGPQGQPVSDNDPSSYFGASPGFTVSKVCSNEPVPQEGPAGFKVTFTNTGNVSISITADEGIGTFDLAAAESKNFDVTENGPFSGQATVDNTVTVLATYTDSALKSWAEYTQAGASCRVGSRVSLLKWTQGVVDPTSTWTFSIWAGEDGFGTGTSLASSSTLNDLDGVLDFGNLNLDKNQVYTLCEENVPASWTSFWQMDSNGDGIIDNLDAILVPYNPNSTDVPPEDLGTRCVEIGPVTGTDDDILLTDGETLLFMVTNNYPGGDPRTPGYWKNWNRCSGGGQATNADANGGWSSGFWLLEDVLDPNIGGGIVWDDMLTDDAWTFAITSCEEGVDILDQRDIGNPGVVGDGVKHSSDAAYTLAMHLLAAQLNSSAGAESCDAVLDAVLAGEQLLDKYDFDGTGDYLLSKNKKVKNDYNLAIQLAYSLDQYNNGELCTGPAVSFVDPLEGDTITGTRTIKVETLDISFPVIQVEFFVDGASIGVDTVKSDGWSIMWDSTGVYDGNHVLQAVATNTNGETGSADINVTVANGNIPDVHTVKVTSLTTGSSVVNKNFWKAEVTVTIDPVLSGAVIYANWDGSTVTGTTDASGKYTFSSNVNNKISSIKFYVDNITFTGYEFDPSGPSEVTVNKP